MLHISKGLMGICNLGPNSPMKVSMTFALSCYKELKKGATKWHKTIDNYFLLVRGKVFRPQQMAEHLVGLAAKQAV